MWYQRTDVQETKHISPSVNQFKSATWRLPVFLPWALCPSSLCGHSACLPPMGTLPVFLLWALFPSSFCHNTSVWALCLSSFSGHSAVFLLSQHVCVGTLPVFLLSQHVCVGTLPVFLLSQHICVGTLPVFLTVFHCCKMAVRQISTGLRLLLGFIHPADLLVAVHLLVPVPFPRHLLLVVTAS